MIIDVKNKPLGRAASEVAGLLRDKNNPNFKPNIAPDNKITIINASKMKLTGKKAEQKEYKRYSGYPGGLKFIPISKVKPEEIFRKAVWGMLPKNKLRAKMIKNLIIKNNEQGTKNSEQK